MSVLGGRRQRIGASFELSKVRARELVKTFSTTCKEASSNTENRKCSPSSHPPVKFTLEALLAQRIDRPSSVLPCKLRYLKYPPKPNARVDKLLGLLSQHLEWNADVEKSLDELNVRLNARVVGAVIKSLRHVCLAVGFFKWAGRLNDFQHTTTTYAAIVRLVGDSGDFILMHAILMEMHKDDCPLTPYFLADIIMAYGNANMAKEALLVFKEMSYAGCPPNLFVYNCLISVLTRCGYLDGAKQVYEMMWKMKECKPDTVTCNMLIDNCGKTGDVLEAERHLLQMKQKGVMPNEKSYASLIGSLNKAGKTEEAFALFQKIKSKRWLVNEVTYTELIKGLGKAGKVKDALKLFHEMEEAGCALRVVTYNVIIDMLARNGLVHDAWMTFTTMEGKQCPPNEVTYNSLIKGYCAAKRMNKALQLFEVMKERGVVPGDYTYATLLCGYCKVGQWKTAYEFLMDTERQYPGNSSTEGATQLDLLQMGFQRSVFVHNIMLDAFVKAGETEMACKHLNSMKEKGCYPDVVSYSTIIHGLGSVGKAEGALELYKEMKQSNLRPNLVTFNTLINVLAKSGKTFEVREIVNEMVSQGLKPDVITYTSLLPTVKRDAKSFAKNGFAAVKRRFDSVLGVTGTDL